MNIEETQKHIIDGIVCFCNELKAYSPDECVNRKLLEEALTRAENAAKLYNADIPAESAVDAESISLDYLVDKISDVFDENAELTDELYGIDRKMYDIADDIDIELSLALEALLKLQWMESFVQSVIDYTSKARWFRISTVAWENGISHISDGDMMDIEDALDERLPENYELAFDEKNFVTNSLFDAAKVEEKGLWAARMSEQQIIKSES